MNQTTPSTSASGSSLLPDSIDAITSAHFVLIAVLAVLVILGIVFGMRLKSRRKAAEREVLEHNAQITGEPPVAASAPVPVAPAPMPAPQFQPVPASQPAPVQTPEPGPAPATEGDTDLTQLKGLGPKVATRLAELGITTLPQLAALTDTQAASLDAQLGPFAGRLARDRWVEQARFLAAGDRPGFEAVFGRL
jgi:predicted flap endonuclease-1-like 5' DNA nuclease